MPLDTSAVVLLPRRRRDGGFTLLELLVVLAILGLLVAFVAPAALRTIGRCQT